MVMRFFWVTDQFKNGVMDIQWHPGQENLADYTSKHHDSKHHQVVRPWYIQEDNSLIVLSIYEFSVGELPGRARSDYYLCSSALSRGTLSTTTCG